MNFEHNETSPTHVERIAQNTLLILQEVPVEEFGDFTYEISVSPSYIYVKELGGKPATHLLVEDILFKTRESKKSVLYQDLDINFTHEIEKFLEKILDKLIGYRFGYRLIIETIYEDFTVLENIGYEKVVKNFEPDSKKICSESILLYPKIPRNGPNILDNFRGSTTLFES